MRVAVWGHADRTSDDNPAPRKTRRPFSRTAFHHRVAPVVNPRARTWEPGAGVGPHHMRILYLHQYFVPPDGSGGTRSYEMARRFVSAGHQVTLITSSAFFPPHYALRERATTLDIDGIQVRVLRIPYSNKMTYADRLQAFARFSAWASIEAARAVRPDVIFATSTPLTIAIPGIAARLRHRRPLVFEVRDLWPELPIAMGALRNPLARASARALEKIAYLASEQIVALSPGMKEGVIRAGYDPNRVTVIPNSCDVVQFRSSTRVPIALPFDTDGRPLVTYAGTLGAINGVHYLVDVAAAAARHAPDIRFVIAGDGAMRDSILQRARMLDVLGRNLWVIPPVPKKAIPSLLARTTVATSLFIDLPPMWNNSANKFFDALAAGKPVMINYGGWQAELLTRTGAGIVVEPGSPERAAMALRELIRDEGRLLLASKAAAALADSEFDRDALATRLLSVLVHSGERASMERDA
jgi:glycosyltransferase involved in cell wall biosynthesis